VSALIERAARRMARRTLDGLLEPRLSREVDAMWPALAEDAEEAVRETLDALREPSDAALRSAEDEFVFQTWDEIRRCLGRLLDAFARENGLAPPAEEQQP
jgi:AcrR family transcriptional regulator